jgi:hypothetical protein
MIESALAKSIRAAGRSTQSVKLLDLEDQDKVAAAVVIPREGGIRGTRTLGRSGIATLSVTYSVLRRGQRIAIDLAAPTATKHSVDSPSHASDPRTLRVCPKNPATSAGALRAVAADRALRAIAADRALCTVATLRAIVEYGTPSYRAAEVSTTNQRSSNQLCVRLY